MKNYILIAVSCFVLCSCASIQPVQLLNIYQETPYSFTVKKSNDEVWSKIIDIFSEKGFTINTIDKSSGLIISSDYSFNNLVTYEMMNGMVNDTTAFIVVSKEALTTDMTQKIIPDMVNGNFNVRIKQEGQGTKVAVNITNLRAKSSAYLNTIKQNTEFQAKSTGVFEKKLEELIKK
jgi:type IV pilus biogenesis protein CpaD/CtpE